MYNCIYSFQNDFTLKLVMRIRTDMKIFNNDQRFPRDFMSLIQQILEKILILCFVSHPKILIPTKFWHKCHKNSVTLLEKNTNLLKSLSIVFKIFHTTSRNTEFRGIVTNVFQNSETVRIFYSFILNFTFFGNSSFRNKAISLFYKNFSWANSHRIIWSQFGYFNIFSNLSKNENWLFKKKNPLKKFQEFRISFFTCQTKYLIRLVSQILTEMSIDVILNCFKLN